MYVQAGMFYVAEGMLLPSSPTSIANILASLREQPGIQHDGFIFPVFFLSFRSIAEKISNELATMLAGWQ